MAEAPQEVAASAPDLEAAIAAVVPLPGTAYRDAVLAALEECRRISGAKLAPGADAPGAPLLVVTAGGTNVGKTSLLNAIAGREVARPTPVARGTKAAVLWVHEAEAAPFRRAGFLPGYGRRALEAPDEPNRAEAAGALLLAAHADEGWRGVALADSPDVDSVLGSNQRVARDLLYAADAVLFVASEEKYNDEVCVAFLERAYRHGKAVLAVLNKAGAPEAAEDFRAKVVPGAAGRAGVSNGAVLAATVPYRVGSAREPIGTLETLAPIRSTLKAWARDAPAVRAAARAGAARALREEAGPAVSLLRREAEALARYRGEVRERAEAAARAYRAGLPALPIYEFERVFRMLSEALKVPVIDDVYDRLRAAAAPVGAFFRRALGIAPGGPGERALGEVRGLPERAAPERQDALRAALATGPGAEALFEIGPEYAERLSQAAERWVDEVLRDLHAVLKASPRAVALGKALKGTLRAAFATAAIVATGHVGLEDLVIAPVVDLLVKAGVERAIDRAYFARKRDEFYDARAAVFRALATERCEKLALGGLRGGASAEAVARLERAVEEVAR